MRNKILYSLLYSTALFATSEVQTLSEVFSKSKVNGNIKYYYIQTDKDNEIALDTSAHANSIGGKLGFETASLYGIGAGVTFMTTNPFLLPESVDASIIGNDNGVRGGDATDGFSVLGEALLAYSYQDFDFTLGRKVIKTPLIHAKEVRMLPSAVEGAFVSYKVNEKSRVGFAYLSRFKQRTSSVFTNIIEHALGVNTQAITGGTNGYVGMLDYEYKRDNATFKAYDYYAKDFMNSFCLDTSYKTKVSASEVNLAAQYIHQNSIGNADRNLAKASSVTLGKQINVNAFGLRSSFKIKDATFLLAYSNVLKDNDKHDSLVLPWDGTPLFTNMITSNDLFQSLYGNGLKADTIYIGGSQALKVAYKQNFNSFGLKGLSASLLYLNTSNSKFLKSQHDYNAVLAYKYDKFFTLALKGIWVQNAASSDTIGAISQIKLLSQYRIIANYKF